MHYNCEELYTTEKWWNLVRGLALAPAHPQSSREKQCQRNYKHCSWSKNTFSLNATSTAHVSRGHNCFTRIFPWVTLLYWDGLPQRMAGWMASPRIPGLSSYFGIPGYSASEGGWVDGLSRDIPGLLWCTGILCQRGWLGGWLVPGYSWTVRVTLVYWDTLPKRLAGCQTVPLVVRICASGSVIFSCSYTSSTYSIGYRPMLFIGNGMLCMLEEV